MRDDWRKVGVGLLTAEGLLLMAAGAATIVVGATLKLMQYDTDYIGLSVDQLCTVRNCSVVAFIVHDRVSFGGVILALGLLYLWLALVPLRKGAAWAWWAMALSGFVGIGSFLTYISYGYLDPVHAATTAEMLLILVVGLAVSYPGLSHPRGIRALFGHSSPAPTSMRLGRALLGLSGMGLLGAGATIMTIGATFVFVDTDIDFIGLQAQTIAQVHSRLVPVIAHDRAGFGGGLVSSGVAVLIVSRFGVRPNGRLLWWVLAAMGTIGYWATTAVHIAVGYTAVLHLLPVYAGAVAFAVGLALSAPAALAAAPLPGSRSSPAGISP